MYSVSCLTSLLVYTLHVLAVVGDIDWTLVLVRINRDAAVFLQFLNPARNVAILTIYCRKFACTSRPDFLFLFSWTEYPLSIGKYLVHVMVYTIGPAAMLV